MHRTPKLLVLAAAGLAVPATASAHVTLQPAEATPGDFTVMNVRVPNERDDKGTTKVVVQLPDGFNFLSYQPVEGWDVDVRREELPEPVEIEPGFEVDEQITRVTFTSDGAEGIIAPGQFRDFPLSVRVPDGKPGAKLTFKALQTYEGGEVVRWIGAPDSDEPAPQVTLAAQEPAAAVRTSAPAARASGDGSGDGLAVAALVVGGLGLLAGVGALARSRARAGGLAAG